MLRPNGFTFAFDYNGNVHEGETYMCGHCGAHKHVRPRERPEDIGGLCKRCMKLLCPGCVENGDCDPIEAKLDRWEKHGVG
jgi:hypothetical protein